MISTTSLLRRRVYAFTCDLSLVVITNYFLMASFTQFIRTVFFHFPLNVQLFFFNKMATLSSISLMSFSFAYFSLFYYLTNGHTMGKSLFGLQVKNENGDEITLKQAMLRSVSYFICAMLGSFLFALSYIRKDQKSLADVFSGSIVENESVTTSKTGTSFDLHLIKAQSQEEPTSHDQDIAA